MDKQKLVSLQTKMSGLRLVLDKTIVRNLGFDADIDGVDLVDVKKGLN